MQVMRIVLMAGIGIFLYLQFFAPKSEGVGQVGLRIEEQTTPEQRAEPSICDIWTQHYRARFTSAGATLKRFELLTAKYQRHGEALDLSTTPHPGFAPDDPNRDDPNVKDVKLGQDREFRQQLFVQWRNPTVPGLEGVPWNVEFDSVDYSTVRADGKTCEFVHRSNDVELRKAIQATKRPYELTVTNTIKNLSDEPRAHAMAIDTTAFWLSEQVKGKMFRVSPYVTHVECQPVEGETVRLLPDAFEADDLLGEEFSKTRGWGWYQVDGPAAYAAVSNAYFAQAIAPVSQPSGMTPQCQVQIENRGARDAPGAGAFYRARLAYPTAKLGPGEEATYSTLTYVGPKEREVLAAAGDGEHQLDNLIDLGFFAEIAKILVKFLLLVYSFVPNWGIAIIVLTITARVLLFPLSVPGIKNMIKMRELKPELDEMNAKYKDDPQARGMAQMELWRKRGVNPMKGCLPQLASMPVWFALYTTLQTAVELYNIPFLWFPDLSEPDPYFILPFVIGGVFFLQQKMMPMQGGDPMQQKMMMYFMPGMFTVFMLFLPSGLGVYMFTNSVLAIVQQQVVERHARRATAEGTDKGQIKASIEDDSPGDAKRSKKRKGGKSRGSRPLLDKGKA